MLKWQWYPSADFLAQAGHMCLGALLTVLPMALGFPWWSTFIGAGVAIAYMLVKEFTFDLWIEGDTVEKGWRDFAYLMVGVVAAGALLCVSKLWR